MKYLLQTMIKDHKDGAIEKFEIFTSFSSLGHDRKIPEGTCRVLKHRLDPEGTDFKLVDRNVDIQELFDANQPKKNTWYSDGQDRVSIDMLVNYLIDL